MCSSDLIYIFMRKTLFVIASLFFSFAYSQTPLKIQQIESLDEIKLYYDSVSDNLNLITIPMEFKVVFNAADSLWISHVYNYAMEEFVGSKDWNSIPLKIKIGDEYLYSVTRYPQQSDTCYYKFISKYFLAPDMDLQDSLSHCIDKMKNEKLNSLSIGTLKIGRASCRERVYVLV